MWSNVLRAARLGVAAILVSSQGGCLWISLTDVNDDRTLRHDGTVTRAAGTPVANAVVEITDGFEYFDAPPPPTRAPCSGRIDGPVRRATTDAQGRYRHVEKGDDHYPGQCLSVRVIPAAESGLAEATVQGESNRFEQPVSRMTLTHRRVDVVLQPR